MAVFRVGEKHRIYGYEQPPFTQQRTFPKGKRGCYRKCCPCRRIGTIPLRDCPISTGKKIDAIREAVRELERAGYIQRSRERDEKGRLRGTDYIIYEQPPNLDLPHWKIQHWKSNIGKSYAGKTYVGKSNAIK